ncbi:unnamed protein product [Phyllotreta striolata]|uniref:CHK kinase-like domain-containing protein n=1 Tax=Phyllotreta striolata TaxID=444603 RepID=A0A9N9XLL4_PHYSR|nr:unnamed protein product [Phyllotreta striolata]
MYLYSACARVENKLPTMSQKLIESHSRIIEKIAEDQGFKEYEVYVNSGSEKGDNYLGVLTAVTVKSDGRKLELILKSTPRDDNARKSSPMRAAFLREIHLYERIFRALRKFQDEFNIAEPFDCYAKLYATSTEEFDEFLVMENLKSDGYQLWNKKIPMNPDHISRVIREYAKFHAANVAMKHNNPALFEIITEDVMYSIWDNEEVMKNRTVFKDYLKTVLDLGYKTVGEDASLIGFLRDVEEEIPKIIFDEFKKSDEYRQSLIHGDAWCNNIMFKYKDPDDTRTPVSLKFIDWQISYVCTPAYDFCYFFLAHSPKEVLDDYKTYLELYYDTFSQQLNYFGCEPEEVFSYSRFIRHINKCMVVGLFACCTVLKVMLCEPTKHLDAKAGKQVDLLESLNSNVNDNEVLRQRIKDIILFVKNNNFLSK